MPLMVLSIGNKVDMEKVVPGISPIQPVTYVSQILDILDRRQLKLAMPTVRGRVIPLDIGDSYMCVFYTEKGMYRCRCEIVDRYRDESFYYVIVKQQSDLERYQRREYYRLNCMMEAQIRRISKEEEICYRKLKSRDFYDENEYWKCLAKLDAMIKEWQDVTITDISGGGARFNSGLKFEAGENIYMKLSIVTKEISYVYELMSKIISCENIQKKALEYETRIEFQGISNKERESIIQFIFEEERKMRQLHSDMR